MQVRMLPQGDRSLITHELARMGHQAPTAVLQHASQPFACKVMGLAHDTATHLVSWLHHHALACWWHTAPGADTDSVDVLIGGTQALLTALRQEARHPALGALAAEVERARHQCQSRPTVLRLGRTALPLGARTLVMGILNVTPDSFSDGGLYLQPEQALKHTEAMLTQGADLIDVGGVSSRPGATPVPVAVERQRVVPVVREIVKRFNALVSVDTYCSEVAQAALDAGAVMINDISALRFDADMAARLASYEAAVVLMHMQGTPQTMQQSPSYRHVVDDIYTFLAERIDYALQHGITRQRIVCDPGFGFGKTLHHNVELLHGLPSLQALGQPLLVGTSRKSFLGRLLQRQVWDRLEGTMASVMYAVMHGAAIVRVHDVGPMVQAVRLIDSVAQQLIPQTEP